MKRNYTLLAFMAIFCISLVFSKKSFSEGLDSTKVETVADGAIEHLTKADFIAKIMDYQTNKTEWVYKNDKPCLIDFYANWCGPCRIAAPILAELAKEYKGQVYFYKINTEEQQELAAVFGIKSIPAFLYCPKEGKPSMISGIAKSNEQTKQMFKYYIDTLLLGKKIDAQ